jgi:beta-D-xylosidase 4
VEYALGAYIAGNDTSHFKEAVNLASTADLVIFVGGTNQTVSEEGRDQTSLALPGVQLQLIQQLEKVSKQPLITIMIGGVSTDISYLKRSSSVGSILWAGYPGMDAGTAVASVLFGEFSPAGRLPITIYPADYANQVQMSNMAMRPTTSPAYPGRTYKFYTGEPVFPFGYGLSYTTFTYTFPSSMQQQHRSHNVHHLAQQYTQGGLHLSSPAVDFHYIVNVTNSGSVRSDLVVLAFLSFTVDESAADVAASPPISALVDFAHLHQLESGQSVEVAFSLQFRALAHVDVDGHSWLLPGEYRLTIGQGEHAEHLGQNGEESAVTFIFNLSGAPQLIHRHTSLQPPIKHEAKASFRAQDDSEKNSIHAD